MIRAIETRYKGYRFRSRLEARWAVFLDSLCVPWEYEKEGFELGEDGRYLPDFWLPTWDAWMEIKPSEPERGYLIKPTAFAWNLGHDLLLVIGNPWPGEHGIDWISRQAGEHAIYGEFVDCRRCEGFCLLNDEPENGGFYGFRDVGPHTCADHDRWPVSALSEVGSGLDTRCKRAYAAARSARFEFGESGGSPAPYKAAPDVTEWLAGLFWGEVVNLPSEEIFDRARAMGISKPALFEAKERLGIKTWKMAGGWVWSVPENWKENRP